MHDANEASRCCSRRWANLKPKLIKKCSIFTISSLALKCICVHLYPVSSLNITIMSSQLDKRTLLRFTGMVTPKSREIIAYCVVVDIEFVFLCGNENINQSTNLIWISCNQPFYIPLFDCDSILPENNPGDV